MQFLKIARFTKYGAYLVDKNSNEVLLPNRYISDLNKIGDFIWCFLYTDSEDRLVAINQLPLALLGDIASLNVVSIAKNGIYLDIGISKDIFMPSKNPSKFIIGQPVVVKIILDKQKRLMANMNISSYLNKCSLNYNNNIVTALPFLKTPLGYNCVVNGQYFGLMHFNDAHNVSIGSNIKAIVKKVRSDGKLDLGIKRNINDSEKKIIEYIKKHNKLHINFSSTSEEIYNLLSITKKTFKISINKLIKTSKIKFIKEDGVFVFL